LSGVRFVNNNFSCIGEAHGVERPHRFFAPVVSRYDGALGNVHGWCKWGDLTMFNWDWIFATPASIVMIIVTAVGIYVSLILSVRLAGLRSFSKMSSFDFAITVAIGSAIASTVLSEKPALLHGITGLFTLFSIQFIVSYLRRHTSFMSDIVDNEPLLLMAGATVLSENLKRARVTVEDLNAHLRVSGVIHPEQVLAVVLETTGDISVLQKNDDFELDTSLLADVRDADRL